MPLYRPRGRWENNIIMNLKEEGANTRNLVDSAQNRDYWETFKCDTEPPGSIVIVPFQTVIYIYIFFFCRLLN